VKRKLLVTAIAALTLSACQEAQETSTTENDVVEVNMAPATTAVPLTPPPGPIVAGEPVPVVAHPDQLAVLRHDDPAQAANKKLLFDMWRTVLNAGHLEMADTFVAEDYRQYSPFQRSGREALKETFSVIPRQDTVPDTMRPAPVTFIAEDDKVVFVAVESLPEPDGSGTYTTTHFNMFEVTDGKLSAHWHPDQTAPCPELPDAANGGPQTVTGVEGVAQFAMLDAATPELAANKRLVFDMWRHLIDAGREETVDLYLAEDYIQHNPNAATGRAGARAYFSSREDQPIEVALRSPLVAMLAEEDIVVQVIKTEMPNPNRAGETYTSTWFDMFRIKDGRIAEHWDAALKPGTDVVEMGSECSVPAE